MSTNISREFFKEWKKTVYKTLDPAMSIHNTALTFVMLVMQEIFFPLLQNKNALRDGLIQNSHSILYTYAKSTPGQFSIQVNS